MSAQRRLIAIGMDAAPGTLVRRWAAEGELPVIAELLRTGASAHLRSPAGHLPESVWPTLLTGTGPGTHGFYNWRETRPGSYVRARHPARSYRQPFWQPLRDGAAPEAGPPRVLALDVPAAPLLAEDGSTMVLGWGQRGAPHHVSWPPGLLERVTERHGPYERGINREAHGRPRIERRQLRALERMATTRVQLLRELMQESAWDLCVVAFPEAHDGGHSFHVYAVPEEYPGDAPRSRRLGDALLRVYRAVDSGIGELIAAAPPGTDVAVFSGMGMRPNTNGMGLLPRAMAAFGYQVPNAPSGASRRVELARRIALGVVPRPLARWVRRRFLPADAPDLHAERLWFESTDWARSRAWAEAEPGSGWIRLNVRGREPAGIVEPGPEYDELCAAIRADLLGLRDPETGRPVIDEVVHRSDVTSGPNVEFLPDLLVKWTRAATVRRAEHPRIGIVEDGGEEWRVSEHDDDGFLVMAGPHVRPNAGDVEAKIDDLAPTLTHLLGGAVPADMDGRVLTELLAPDVGPVRRIDVDLSDDAWAGARPDEG